MVDKFKQLGLFFQEVRSELKKVTWPNRQEVINSTVVVVVTTVTIAVYLGVWDWGLSQLLNLLVGR